MCPPHLSTAFTVAALVLVAIVALWWTFRSYPEKRAAEHFFDAVVAGDMATAYRLWKPQPSYKMEFPGGLGTERLLRPGEELQNYPRRFAARIECGANRRGDQSFFADAQSYRSGGSGKKSQDPSGRSVGGVEGQVVYIPTVSSAELRP